MSAWIFGYGSLIWRPDFPFAERRTAAIRGWSRRFWQGSTDHRGVPGDPGRVVTLIREDGAECWGRAYRIESGNGDEIFDRLAYREKGGYDRITLDLHFSGTQAEPVPGFVYFANPDNPTGSAPRRCPTSPARSGAAAGPAAPTSTMCCNSPRRCAGWGWRTSMSSLSPTS